MPMAATSLSVVNSDQSTTSTFKFEHKMGIDMFAHRLRINGQEVEIKVEFSEPMMTVASCPGASVAD
jgi:hypothetical protein